MTPDSKGPYILAPVLALIAVLLFVSPVPWIYAIEAGLGLSVLIAAYRLLRMPDRSKEAGVILIAFLLIVVSKEVRTLGSMSWWHAKLMGVVTRDVQVWLAAMSSLASTVLTLGAFSLLCFAWSGLDTNVMFRRAWQPLAVGAAGAVGAYYATWILNQWVIGL